jgi:hypothetical protein
LGRCFACCSYALVFPAYRNSKKGKPFQTIKRNTHKTTKSSNYLLKRSYSFWSRIIRSCILVPNLLINYLYVSQFASSTLLIRCYRIRAVEYGTLTLQRRLKSLNITLSLWRLLY